MAEQTFATPFSSLPTRIDLPATDHKIIAWWRDNRIFERSLERTKDGASWVFYEGPPTANGSPGTHHVEARVFKDLFPRYRTMKATPSPVRPAGTATAAGRTCGREGAAPSRG